MPRRKQSKGKCAYCEEEMTKSRMVMHLANCLRRQEFIAKAEHKKAQTETLYHLRVQDAWRSEFWLDFEMQGAATLYKRLWGQTFKVRLSDFP